MFRPWPAIFRPTKNNNSFYCTLIIVLSWPEGGRSRSKHVTKYNLIVIIASCLTYVLYWRCIIYYTKKSSHYCFCAWIALSLRQMSAVNTCTHVVCPLFIFLDSYRSKICTNVLHIRKLKRVCALTGSCSLHVVLFDWSYTRFLVKCEPYLLW